ncbi:putative bifunctional diguanylate cyclase/phosphodiesterase [Actinoplanes sichuanensis]|uniref:Bifunctional diguanylate cyclase/phosphodiesterase n=1 Tax=Actinoplanes sichuanensis TaxID=512349 RepID=A0ABW4A1W8_9ACTN
MSTEPGTSRADRMISGIGRSSDPTFVLPCLTAVYAVVCALALLPGWLSAGQPAIAAAGAVSAAATVGLRRARRLPPRIVHTVLGVLPVIVAWLTLAAGGGVDSASFCFLNVFVTAFAAMFLHRRAFVAHLTWCLASCGTALSLTDLGNRENGYFVLVLAITMTVSGLLLGGLVRDVWSAATHDPLTGLLNEQGLRAAMNATGPGLLVTCDIDRFSDINAAVGRDGGDQVLTHVAATIRRLWPDAMLARPAGDVFAAYVPGITSDIHVEDIVEQAQRLHQVYIVKGLPVDVTVTAGAVVHDDTDPSTALRRAAAAVSRARLDNVACQLWTTALDDEHRDDLHLLADLRAGLRRGELLLHFQPQVAAHTHHVVAAEALVRWQHPTRGLLGPAAFLPAAERSPLMNELTDHVLAEATRRAAGWHAGGFAVPVSVNISARSLTDHALPERIAAHLATSGLPAHLLTVEITETAVMSRPDQAAHLLERIRALGVRVSIDDFGTGNTSLALLTDLPLDEVKLDRKFVAAATAQPRAAAVVTGIAELAQRLGLHTVAEGVEDTATSALLDTVGFDLQQGYLHARPEPAADFLTRLREPRSATVSPLACPAAADPAAP